MNDNQKEKNQVSLLKRFKINRLIHYFIILSVFLNVISPYIILVDGNSKKDLHIFNGDVIGAPKISSTQNSREGYAILVGVSDYPGEDHDLQYCDDDSADLYNFVQNQFHIPQSHIIWLNNSDASVNEIKYAISNVSSLMDSNDMLFFAFSGHGSANIETSQYSWSIESDHNYDNNEDIYWHYYVPGASMMRVHFTRIDVEYNYDGVFIGDNNDRTTYWDLFTGSYTNVWSNWVFTDDIYVNLYSDLSYVDWGFEVDSIQVGYFGAPYEICPYDGIETGISGSDLDTELDLIPGQVICLLDSCHSGGVGEYIESDNRYILTASQADEFSLEDEARQNGLFTYSFLQSWENSEDLNSDGVISLEETFNSTYSTTVSRSSSLGSPHHPIEFDGIENDVIFEPNAMISSVNEYGDDQIRIAFILSGLGIGKIITVYYDFENQKLIRSEIVDNLQSSSELQEKYITKDLPGLNVSGITIKAIQSYNEYSEIFNSSIELESNSLSSSQDFDHDSLSDLYEFQIGTHIWDDDPDNDALPDNIEVSIKTDPFSSDSDFDGMPDGWEYFNGLNPLINDSREDPDYDGLLNYEEFFYGTDPLKADSDNDNYSDKEEIERNTNPLNSLSNPLTRFLGIGGGILGIAFISTLILKKFNPEAYDKLFRKSKPKILKQTPIQYSRSSSFNVPSTNINQSEPTSSTQSDLFGLVFQKSKLKICPHCGSQIIDENSSFCIHCGQRYF